MAHDKQPCPSADMALPTVALALVVPAALLLVNVVASSLARRGAHIRTSAALSAQ
jgi:hypothetical protein